MSNPNQLVPFEGALVPAVLAQCVDDADDLTSGVSGGFAVVSFRGSKWRIKYQGEETPVVDTEGNPVSTLEVVLVKANAAISKNYYESAYEEGAAEAPDCFSLDGIAPDPAVQAPVSTSCAKCPKNLFGSRITPAGKKAKECADNRRMAVLPYGDLKNETFGGPMLLRVPAASLADLKMFGEALKRRGYPYNAVSVRLGFDIDASYPKLTFKAIRPLSNEEAAIVAEHLHGDVVQRILATAGELNGAAPEAAVVEDEVFEQPPAPTPLATPAKPIAAKPAAKAQATVAVVPKAQVQAAAQVAAKPAAKATFGAPAAKPAAAAPAKAAGPKPVAVAKPKPAPAPAVIEGEVLEATAEVVEDPSNQLDAEIEGILGDLDSLS